MDEDKLREKRQRDFDDAQNEAAGVDTGRIRRFLTEDRSPEAAEARKRQQGWADMLTLQMSLDRIRDRLAELDRASFRAWKAAERRMAETSRELEDIQNRASADDQGRRIYLSADHSRAFYENGVQLSADQKARAHWKENAPTWEQYQDASGKADDAVRELGEINRYREKIRQGKQDIDSGADIDLDSLEKDLGKMPTAVREQLEKSTLKTSAAHQYMGDGPVNAPDLSAEFAAARDINRAAAPAPKFRALDL